MAYEQVLEHEVVARAHPGQDGREQEPQEVEHASKITDRRSREVLPPHNLRSSMRAPEVFLCETRRSRHTPCQQIRAPEHE